MKDWTVERIEKYHSGGYAFTIMPDRGIGHFTFVFGSEDEAKRHRKAMEELAEEGDHPEGAPEAHGRSRSSQGRNARV